MCVPFDFPSPAAFLHFLQHPPVFEIMVLAKFLKIAQLQAITYREVALVQTKNGFPSSRFLV